MSSKLPSGRQDTPAVTLGDLLYAKPRQVAIPEADWVRLVNVIAAGDEAALRALYERTHRLVFTLALRITNDRESAEQVTVDVFHEVWRRAAAYDPIGTSVVGWILNHARSRAIDLQRLAERNRGGES